MINTILLDLDDTLINTSKLYREALPRVYKVFITRTKLKEITFTEFEKMYLTARTLTRIQTPIGAPAHNRAIYFQKLVENIDYQTDIDLIYEMYKIYYDYIYKHASVLPGVEDFLKKLKQQKKTIIIVSDGNAHVRIKKLKSLHIANYVDYIVSSEESGFEKPHPASFLLALHKARSMPERAVMVGNNPRGDILGAKLLGIKSIQITIVKEASQSPQNLLETADLISSNFEEVFEYILKL